MRRHSTGILAACVLAITAWGQPTSMDAAALRELIVRAYADLGPYECRAREWMVFGEAPPPTILERMRSVPGLQEGVHPVLGTPCFDHQRVVVRGDARGGVRVESVQMLRQGRAGQPPQVTTWNRREQYNGPDVAALVPLPEEDARSLRDLQKQGVSNRREQRGYFSFIEMAAWAVQVVREDTALTVRPAGTGEWVLAAPGFGVEITIDGATGEMRRMRHSYPNGRYQEWWWEGRLDSIALPARHPRLQFVSAADTPDGPVRHGGYVEFDRVVRVEPHDPSIFTWQSAYPFAWNRQTNEVIRPDGTVDEERTRERRGLDRLPAERLVPGPKQGAAPSQPTGAQIPPPAPSRVSFGRIVAVSGIVLGIGAGAIWVGRRWA
jgi:hypothetical protein